MTDSDSRRAILVAWRKAGLEVEHKRAIVTEMDICDQNIRRALDTLSKLTGATVDVGKVIAVMSVLKLLPETHPREGWKAEFQVCPLCGEPNAGGRVHDDCADKEQAEADRQEGP